MALTMTRCACWNLHTATKVLLVYIMITSLLTGLLVALDLADIYLPSSIITGSYDADWRYLYNDVWTVLDSIMIIAHTLMAALAIATFVVVRRDDIKASHRMLLAFTIMMALYVVCEFAVNTYEFTWYNQNIWRLPFLFFLCMYWAARLIFNVVAVIVFHSRVVDLRFVKKYDLLNMPGVNGSLSAASNLSGSMRSLHSSRSRDQLYSSASAIAINSGAARY